MTKNQNQKRDLQNAGREIIAKRLKRDLSKVYEIPTVPLDTPMARCPEGLLVPLFKYQRRSLHRMLQMEDTAEITGIPLAGNTKLTTKGGVLADTVGMGKTAQMIALFLMRPSGIARGAATGFESRANLVLAPAHLCQQWRDEIRKFVGPGLTVVLVDTPERHFHVSSAQLLNADVVVVSVEYLLSKEYADPTAAEHLPRFHALRWRRLVFDECHETVRVSAGDFESLMALDSVNTWCVTATPFPHLDQSMYGIHHLLGIRLTLHVSNSPFVKNEHLKDDHPFQVLKTRLYLRNTPESVGDEWGAVTGVHRSDSLYVSNSVRLSLTQVKGWGLGQKHCAGKCRGTHRAWRTVAV